MCGLAKRVGLWKCFSVIQFFVSHEDQMNHFRLRSLATANIESETQARVQVDSSQTVPETKSELSLWLENRDLELLIIHSPKILHTNEWLPRDFAMCLGIFFVFSLDSNFPHAILVLRKFVKARKLKTTRRKKKSMNPIGTTNLQFSHKKTWKQKSIKKHFLSFSTRCHEFLMDFELL